MPIYLDTRGNSVLSVAICDRCSRKFAYTELYPDPNFPGMRVCKEDLDQFDPWRLPARQTENISLRFPRPDVSIALQPNHLVTQSGFQNGNSVLIEGVPPIGGASGDLNTLNSPANNLLPTIFQVSPNEGVVAGGTRVLVTGTNFAESATAVQFDGTNGTDVEVLNPFQLWVTTPSHAAGNVNVKVITAFGNTVRQGAFTYI